jgi:hypothetical protein
MSHCPLHCCHRAGCSSGSVIYLCSFRTSARTLVILPQAFSGFTQYTQEYDGIIPGLGYHLLDIHSSSLFINHSTVRRYVACCIESVAKWFAAEKQCLFGTCFAAINIYQVMVQMRPETHAGFRVKCPWLPDCN